MLNKQYTILQRKRLVVVFLAVLTVAFLYLLYLPANLFDEGESMCFSVLFFNQTCYGCGLTRGIQHLIHLDFEKAYAFNKLSFVVFPLAIYVILSEAKKYVQKADRDSKNK